jgi:glyoxylase-like metal-dependent hydrolase (beta-lactamase superfamily II)
VLPTITPHISGLIPNDPLAQYLESLDRLAALPHVSTVLPAHGHPFANLAKRTDEIKAHHAERLEQLRQMCDVPEWTSVLELSHQLFAPRSWGSMAEAETYAHLERLRVLGEVTSRQEGGVISYRV